MKFQIGDKVKLNNGHIGTILRVSEENNEYFVDSDFSTFWCHETHVEPVIETPKKREQPYKSKNRPTVYSLAKHNAEMQQKDQQIERLTEQVKTENELRCGAFDLLYKERDDHKETKRQLKKATDHLAHAESALVYHDRRTERAELIIDKLIGWNNE